MSASLKPVTAEEFLAWEREQPLRYEFDGIQPVAMTGGSVAHVRTITRVTTALALRLNPPREVFSSELKVRTTERIRYPDVSVVCDAPDPDADLVFPTVVFEVLSPSTTLTDRRVKPIEYAPVPSIQAYVVLEAERPEATVRRRTSGWEEEIIEGLDAELRLPEIEVTLPLSAIYAPRG